MSADSANNSGSLVPLTCTTRAGLSGTFSAVVSASLICPEHHRARCGTRGVRPETNPLRQRTTGVGSGSRHAVLFLLCPLCHPEPLRQIVRDSLVGVLALVGGEDVAHRAVHADISLVEPYRRGTQFHQQVIL